MKVTLERSKQQWDKKTGGYFRKSETKVVSFATDNPLEALALARLYADELNREWDYTLKWTKWGPLLLPRDQRTPTHLSLVMNQLKTERRKT